MKNQRSIGIEKITLMGLAMSINVIGAFIAYSLKLPIYLDSIGTILIACMLGPKYAIVTGVFGSLISGMTFDMYSIYFAPVQISTGLIAGIMYKKNMLKGYKTILGVLSFALPTSILSSIISSMLFGGVTSSGSSYIVQVLSTLGVNEVFSIFITQVFTDYTDKFIAVLLVNTVVNQIPYNIKVKLDAK